LQLPSVTIAKRPSLRAGGQSEEFFQMELDTANQIERLQQIQFCAPSLQVCWFPQPVAP
jgi:hypothetical protein